MLWIALGVCLVLVSSVDIESRSIGNDAMAKTKQFGANRRRLLHFDRSEAERAALISAIQEVLSYEAQHPEAAAMAANTEVSQPETTSSSTTTTSSASTTSFEQYLEILDLEQQMGLDGSEASTTSSTAAATSSTTAATSTSSSTSTAAATSSTAAATSSTAAATSSTAAATSSTTAATSTSSSTSTSVSSTESSTSSTSTTAKATSTTATEPATSKADAENTQTVEISDPDLPDIEREETDEEDASGLDSEVDEDGVKHMVLQLSTKSLINLWLIVISVLIINLVLFYCYTQRKRGQGAAGFTHQDHLDENSALHDV